MIDQNQTVRTIADPYLEIAVKLLRRYRNEVPPGHQPHMICEQVDAFLLDVENGEAVRIYLES